MSGRPSANARCVYQNFPFRISSLLGSFDATFGPIRSEARSGARSTPRRSRWAGSHPLGIVAPALVDGRSIVTRPSAGALPECETFGASFASFGGGRRAATRVCGRAGGGGAAAARAGSAPVVMSNERNWSGRPGGVRRAGGEPAFAAFGAADRCGGGDACAGGRAWGVSSKMIGSGETAAARRLRMNEGCGSAT